MIYAIRILMALVLVETLVGGVLLALTAARAVPQLPDVELSDPLIMPKLRELAREAEFGGADQWTRLGQALLGKGFYGHAEQAFREALRQNPRDFSAQFGLGYSLDRTGRTEQSTLEYHKLRDFRVTSTEQQQRHYDARYGMGRNALREEKPDLAESHFEQLLGVPPGDYQMAKLLIRSGKAERALRIIERNLTPAPNSLEFHFLNYRAQQQLGRTRAAANAADEMERASQTVQLNFSEGYVAPFEFYTGISPKLRELERVAGGPDLRRIDQLCREINRVMGDAPMYALRLVDEQRLDVALRSHQPERVLELVEEMRKAGREDAVTLQYEGDALAMLGKSQQAAEAWQRALKITPTAELRQKLGQ